MELYVLRHGETNGNRYKLDYGLINFPINLNGIRDTVMAKEKVKEIKPDIIICSPMLRTIQTMNIVNYGIPVVFDRRLVEIDAGMLTGIPYGFLDSSYYNVYKTNYCLFAEKYDNVFKRVYSFLDEISKCYRDKRILLVTHNGIIRIIKTYFYGVPSDGNIKKYGIKNSEIIKIR